MHPITSDSHTLVSASSETEHSKMSYLKMSIILFIGLLFVANVFGQYGLDGFGGDGRGGGGFGEGHRGSGRRGFNGGSLNSLGRGNGGRRYRSTLYNNDDVYGYEANYPGGEVLYVNYRSSDARAKRRQEFARSSPYISGDSQAYTSQYQQGGRSNRAADFEEMMW